MECGKCGQSITVSDGYCRSSVCSPMQTNNGYIKYIEDESIMYDARLTISILMQFFQDEYIANQPVKNAPEAMYLMEEASKKALEYIKLTADKESR